MKQDRHRAKLEQPEITLSVSTPGFVLGLAGGEPGPPPDEGFRITEDGAFRILEDGSRRAYT